jgi:hypothetical protein
MSGHTRILGALRLQHVLLALLCFFSLPGRAADSVTIAIGQSVVNLTGPWKFHQGDDPGWAAADFDDSAWNTFDFAAPPGAHDSDVGLTGYSPGWTARGFAGYWGYAWYRLRVNVDPLPEQGLALAGPPSVDSAYQAFVNGHLLGSAGDFSGPRPIVYSIQPRMFELPRSLWMTSQGSHTAVIAFRVWMGSGMLAEAPDVGGIHIAPALGSASGVESRYRLQWLQTFNGYIVDLVEPISFILLAAMALVLLAFDRGNNAYAWLSAALTLLALSRVNQVIYFWGQYESLLQYAVIRAVIFEPLVLGAWVMTWRAWFKVSRPAVIPVALAVLTLLYVVSQMMRASTISGNLATDVNAAFAAVSRCLRLGYVMLMAYIVCYGVRRQPAWLAPTCAILVSIGLFASELSRLHIPGIWFPFGVGVSRTQYAYAAFGMVLLALLLRRLLGFAARDRAAASG